MRKQLFILLILVLGTGMLCAQNQDKGKTGNMPKFPIIENAEMNNPIIYGQPQLITGSKFEIRTEKHGLAYPAYFDWNKDGLMDLLIGEFETNRVQNDIFAVNTKEEASNLKVYLNIGTKEKPEFTGEFEYAKDTEGNIIRIPSW